MNAPKYIEFFLFEVGGGHNFGPVVGGIFVVED